MYLIFLLENTEYISCKLYIVARELNNSPLLPLTMLLVSRLPLMPLQHRLHPSMGALSTLLCIAGKTTLELKKGCKILDIITILYNTLSRKSSRWQQIEWIFQVTVSSSPRNMLE